MRAPVWNGKGKDERERNGESWGSKCLWAQSTGTSDGANQGRLKGMYTLIRDEYLPPVAHAVGGCLITFASTTLVT
jgi:hypothetical protein